MIDIKGLARAAAIAAALCLGTALPAAAAEDGQAMTAAPVKGEFDDQCAMGLASGQNVKTDCSVNWTDADGHVYCFSSESSKEAFLKDPAGNLDATPASHLWTVDTAAPETSITGAPASLAGTSSASFSVSSVK